MLAIKRQSFGLEALSGAGKSMTLDLLANHNKYGDDILLPPETVYILQLSSKTAHMYDAREINKAKLIYIEELQKAGNSLEMTEFLKNLSEGKDVSRNVRDQAHRQNLKQVIKKGKGIMYTLALENPHSNDAEMKRRFIVLSTNVSKEQTERVVKRKSEERFARKRFALLDDKKISRLKGHIADCLLSEEKIVFENPFSEFIGNLMPVPDQKIRSFCDHFFNLVEASALFHKKKRISFLTGQTRLTKHIFIDIEDIAIIHKLYSEQFMRDVHGIPVLGLEVLKAFDHIDYDKVIHKVPSSGLSSFIKKESDDDKIIKWAAIVDIRDTLKNKLNIILSHAVCKTTCDDLYNAGYLLKRVDGRVPEYAVADKVSDFTNAIDWQECFKAGLKNMEQWYPEFLDEWIKSQEVESGKIGYLDPLMNQKVLISSLPKPNQPALSKKEIELLELLREPLRQGELQKMRLFLDNTDIFNSLMENECIIYDDELRYTISEKGLELLRCPTKGTEPPTK